LPSIAARTPGNLNAVFAELINIFSLWAQN